MWKGGFYEFRGGNAFLKIPNITEEEVGNYTIEGNTITFENNKAEKQNANIKINNNLMTLSFAPEMYRETLMKSSLGNIEVDINVKSGIIVECRIFTDSILKVNIKTIEKYYGQFKGLIKELNAKTYCTAYS